MNKLSLQFILLLSFILIQSFAQTLTRTNVSFPNVDKEPLSDIPANAIVLHEGWQMKESAIVGMDGEKFSSSGYKAKNWYPTTVPSTVLGVLVRNGVYPDPYIGMNNMKIPDMSDDLNKRYDLNKFSHLPDGSNPWAKPYWFRKEFEVPGEYLGKTVWLNLDGINYRADVWINGKLVADSGKVVGMFKRFRLNVTDFVRPGKKNALAINIYPLDFPGDPLYEQVEGLKGILGPNGGDADILRNVTQYSTIGWDWVPAVRDRNIGIWQHVSINASGPVAVEDPAAFTRLIISKDTTADVTVRFFITNTAKTDQKIKLNISFQRDNLSNKKVLISTSVEIKANERQEVIFKSDRFPQLRMHKPDLWWPVTYGRQPLYNLEVQATIDGQISSTAKGKFGVRELTSYILPSGGRAFAVNGKTIRVTGGAWISDFLLSWSAQRYRDEVRLMAEGNATVVRINGCSIIAPDVFYNECDKYGLLVWQDLSRTSVTPGVRKDGLDSRRPPACDSTIYINNMVDCISRLRGHPSLLLWCGSNEDALQENTGKALQNKILPQMDGTRIFIASSSEQPEWSNIEIGTFTGGPWQMVPLLSYYELYKNSKGFESKNEIGLASLPPINTISESIPDINTPDPATFPFNKTMGYHDATGEAIMGSHIKIMDHGIGKSSSIAELLKWGDLYNNQVYRTIFEAANKARPRNEGTMLWKSNAAWPSFNWQIYNWNLRPNAGYYTMKSACKPIHVQFSHDDFGIQGVSTLSEDLKGIVRCNIFSSDGKKKFSKEFKTYIPSNKTVRIDSLTEIRNDSSLYFVALDLLDQTGKIIDRTVIWTQKHSIWKELLTIPIADIECDLLKETALSNEIEYIFKIKNTSSFPVINVMLEITNGSFGREILPAFWDDNALTMMPGEIRKVKVKVRKELIKKSPCILVEGLNVNPASWDMKKGEKESLTANIFDFNISSEDKSAIINFQVGQAEKTNRIMTFPVKLMIDGKLIRYVSVAAEYGREINGKIRLKELTSGEHLIQLGKLKKTISYNNVETK